MTLKVPVSPFDTPAPIPGARPGLMKNGRTRAIAAICNP
jgi:hypothetical protein